MEMGSELSKTVSLSTLGCLSLYSHAWNMFIKFRFSYHNRCFIQITCITIASAINDSDWFGLSPLCQVATFIVQKVLLDDVGLEYMCTTAERFFALGRVLGNMVTSLAEGPSPRLLKHIIRCYLRLTDNQKSKSIPTFLHSKHNIYTLVLAYTIQLLIKFRACEALRNCLPDLLRDPSFSSCLCVSFMSLW